MEGSAFYTNDIIIIIRNNNEIKSKWIFIHTKRYLQFSCQIKKRFGNGTVFGVADFKSLYKNTSHDLGLKALEY